jgi:hypothetical protein
MPAVLENLEKLPPGSHAVSFHASRAEAERHALDFIRGAPEGQPVSYWVSRADLAHRYNELLAREDPRHVGCVVPLPTEQVELREGRLRPVSAVFAFIEQHPDGATAAGETISSHWNASNVDAHLEYEAWFDAQPRDDFRYLCPYDLRQIPSTHPEQVMRELGRVHPQVVFSPSPEPAVRLLQLFVFEKIRELPPVQELNLGWALRTELVQSIRSPAELELTHRGDDVVAEWSARTMVV